MKILVTGGLGYIGSHTCVQMIEAGIDPIIIDNLCNAKVEVLSRIEALTGKQPTFYRGDVRNEDFLDSVFTKHEIQAVIHFAGLKAVGESVVKPLEYYDNNVNGSLVLARSMRKAGVKVLCLVHLQRFTATRTSYLSLKIRQLVQPPIHMAAVNTWWKSVCVICSMLKMIGVSLGCVTSIQLVLIRLALWEKIHKVFQTT